MSKEWNKLNNIKKLIIFFINIKRIYIYKYKCKYIYKGPITPTGC